MQSFDIAVNVKLPTDRVYVSCQRWTRPMMSFIKTLDARIPGLASSTLHSRSLLFRCSCAQLLSSVSKVGLTVKTFIGIMKCRIFNCCLRQTTLFCYCILAVPLPASTSKYTAMYCIVYTVINATVQNSVFKCKLQDRIMKYVAISTL